MKTYLNNYALFFALESTKSKYRHINKLVCIAREIMEHKPTELCSVIFSYFPKGACGSASGILSLWLESKGYKNIEYVCGSRSEQSHGWLEIPPLIIDITSDQFPDGLGPVFVGEDRTFHDTFFEQERYRPALADALLPSYRTFINVVNRDFKTE